MTRENRLCVVAGTNATRIAALLAGKITLSFEHADAVHQCMRRMADDIDTLQAALAKAESRVALLEVQLATLARSL